VIDELAGTLTRVDTEVMEADEPIRIGGSPEAIAVGAGGVWILDQGAGIVTTYDPSSGRIGSPIRVGVGPTDIATGLGAAWVVNRDDRTISRIDPVTRTVETMPIETADLAAPASIAVDEATGSLWVTVVERI
jgi:streptogramin lyase